MNKTESNARLSYSEPLFSGPKYNILISDGLGLLL